MKKYLYAVKDKKAKCYDGYMILENQAQAVRSFASACQKNEVFNSWPEDFEIYEIAEINTDLGIVIPHKEPKFLAAAISFVEKPAKEKQKETQNEKDTAKA